MKVNKSIIGFIVIVSCMYHTNALGGDSDSSDDGRSSKGRNRRTMEDSHGFIDLAGAAGTFAGGPVGGRIAKRGTAFLVDAAHDPNFVKKCEEKVEALVGEASEKAQELQADTGNMLHSYKTTFGSVKDPLIAATVAGLNLQKKSVQAKIFRKKATSPYYPYALASFVSGASLLAMTPLVGRDSTSTLLKGSGLCFTTSFGCWYKSRLDVIALRKQVENDFRGDK